MGTPHTPKEVECLGFKLSDISVNFNKGFAEFGASYVPVVEPSDPVVCEEFLDILRSGPKTISDMVEKAAMQQKKMFNEPIVNNDSAKLPSSDEGEVIELDAQPSVTDEL
jgi:hypothetical protein